MRISRSHELFPWCFWIFLFSVFSFEAIAEKNHTIKLGDSTFDLRYDSKKIRRSDRFIPITEVPWIYDLLKQDPDLSSVVVHIKFSAPETEGGKMLWLPDTVKPLASVNLPLRLQPRGMQISSSDGVETVKYFFLPKEGEAYYTRCYYSPIQDVFIFCSLVMRYSNDPKLRLSVRIYHNPRKELPDFQAVAYKVHRFVRCELDVKPVRVPRPPRPDSQILPEALTYCSRPIFQ